MAAVDCECVWRLVFARFPSELFNDQFLAHELLRFLRLNLESLQLRVPQYIRSFPNLLKVKARLTDTLLIVLIKEVMLHVSVCLCSCWRGTARR